MNLTAKQICSTKKGEIMSSKTIMRKNGFEVEIEECHKIINGSIKFFCIKETEQYFCREKTAIRAANDLLLRKSLTKYRYEERKKEKAKRRGAYKVIEVFYCFQETEKYVKRWEGIIYLETKKRLCKELKEKLKITCEKHGFKNAHEAIGFIERSKK